MHPPETRSTGPVYAVLNQKRVKQVKKSLKASHFLQSVGQFTFVIRRREWLDYFRAIQEVGWRRMVQNA